MFETIVFGEEELDWLKSYYCRNSYNETISVKALTNIAKINIFVGSNNSGKSRFLRNVFHSMSNTKREIIGYYNYDRIIYDINKLIEVMDASYGTCQKKKLKKK